jgi:hypothetical protein
MIHPCIPSHTLAHTPLRTPSQSLGSVNSTVDLVLELQRFVLSLKNTQRRVLYVVYGILGRSIVLSGFGFGVYNLSKIIPRSAAVRYSTDTWHST